MGWDVENLTYCIPLLLDSHGGDKERRHEALAAELRQRCRAVLRPVLTDPRYAEIMLYDDVACVLGEDDADG